MLRCQIPRVTPVYTLLVNIIHLLVKIQVFFKAGSYAHKPRGGFPGR